MRKILTDTIGVKSVSEEREIPEADHMTVLGHLNGALFHLENGDVPKARREINDALELLGFGSSDDHDRTDARK